MENQKTLYSTLGIKSDATIKEIKKAYRSLSKEHHPDKGGDEELFKDIADAYRILSNEKLREMYDNGGDVVEVRSKQEEMMARLYMFVEKAINNDRFSAEYSNLFALIREYINEDDMQRRNAIENYEGKKRNLEEICKRLKNADMIVLYVENNINKINRSIANEQEEKDYLQMILSFIENMEYEYDEDTDETYISGYRMNPFGGLVDKLS